ncbi:hypothetical protein ABZS86_18685 [Streptomyces sp. NPDC005355]|uniref:hypothetical protein n=1 Tax=Streptomyces sp. NPDC005355 TaxID=3157038 RepID=UPI0033A4666F
MDMTLEQAMKDLRRDGVLSIIEEVTQQVYETNADRYEPAHGDDLGTFGQLTWRNIANLVRARLVQAGIQAHTVAGGAVEIISGPWVVRFYKFRLTASDKVPAVLEKIRWDGSGPRLRGAVANSSAGVQLAFGEASEWDSAFEPTIRQGHVRIMHTGDPETGGCVIELGLPRDNRAGGSPWLDGTAQLHNGLHASLPAPRASSERHEQPFESEDRAGVTARPDLEDDLSVSGAQDQVCDDEGLPIEDDSKTQTNFTDLADPKIDLKRRTKDPDEQPKTDREED